MRGRERARIFGCPESEPDLDAWLQAQWRLDVDTTTPVDLSSAGPLPELTSLSVRGPVTGLEGLLASPRLSDVALQACPTAVRGAAPLGHVSLMVRQLTPTDVVDVAHWNLKTLHVENSTATDIRVPDRLPRLLLHGASTVGWLSSAVRGVSSFSATACDLADLRVLRGAEALTELALCAGDHGSTLDLTGLEAHSLTDLSVIAYRTVIWPAVPVPSMRHVMLGVSAGRLPDLRLFPVLDSLVVTDRPEIDLDELHLPPTLSRFAVRGGGMKVRGMDHVASAPHLEELDLFATAADDVGFATQLPRLRRLGLRQTQVHDLEPLSGHPSLEHIDVADTHVSDVSPLAACPRLSHLEITDTNDPPTGLSTLGPTVEVLD